MKSLLYNNPVKNLDVPESWDELSPDQYLRIVKLLRSGEQDIDIVLDKALHILSGKSLYKFLRIPFHVRAAAYEHIKWIAEQQNITKQLVPSYDGLYGPASEFANIKLSEFHQSEMFFYIFHKEQTQDSLDDFVSVLYRERKKNYDTARDPDGDIRIPFNYQDIQWHKRKIVKWPLHVKQAIAMWYAGCKELLSQSYPTAFDGSEDDGYFEGIFPVIRNIAGQKYGSFSDVEQMDIHLAFKEICIMLEEQQELEKQLKAQSS